MVRVADFHFHLLDRVDFLSFTVIKKADSVFEKNSSKNFGLDLCTAHDTGEQAS